MKTAYSILIAGALACSLALSAAPGSDLTTIKASDPKIIFIGRTQVSDTAVSFDWTGVYVRVRFKGRSLSLKASDSKKNYYNVWLDGSMAAEPDKIIAIHGKDTTIAIFTPEEIKTHYGKDKKAADGPHQVILQKRTEGEQGRTSISEFITDGDFLQADAPKERIIEYIGDSYTCGFGSENSVATDPFKPETENQNKTYACAVARYFGADQIVIAHSGIGVARNYNGKTGLNNMPERYLQTFDMDKDARWQPGTSEEKPDITVIYLGTNDFSTGAQPALRIFKENYITLLKEIKTFYGEDHPVLCIAPRNDLGMFDYIRASVDACGMKNVHIMAFTTSIHNDSTDLGACWHPNYTGHIKKAYSVIPYISTIMGWEMTGNEVK